MPKPAFIAAFFLLLCLPLLVFAQSDTPIRIGDTVEGTLTTDNLSARYVLSGNRGDQLTISLVSSDFDGYLTLLDPDGDELASDDDSGSGNDPLIEDVTLPVSGQYVIVVDSYNQLATGDYTLTIEGIPAPVTPTPTPGPTGTPTPVIEVPTTPEAIEIGDTVERALSASADAYPFAFSGTAGQTVTITLSSSDFDAYLVLEDESGDQLAVDDDSAGNLNARISEFTLPADGTYIIQAGSYGSGVAGSFTLTLEDAGSSTDPTPEVETPTPDETPEIVTVGNELTIGASATGTLEPDQVSAEYTFEGRAGEAVTITLSSTAFDSFLSLRDSQGTVIAEDDDSGGNRNAQITNFSLPNDDTYTIVVSSLGGFGSGGYLLTLEAGEVTVEPTAVVLTSDGGDYELGTTVIGTLGDSPAVYTFEGAAGQFITVTLESSRFDPYLRLMDDSGAELASDDDSAGSLNARISNFSLPADGTYTLEVSAASGFGSGEFTLTSAVAQIQPTAEPTAEPTFEPTLVPTPQSTVIAEPPGVITFGETVASQLTGQGPNTHTFEGQVGDVVTITVESDDFDVYVRLLDDSGRELISDDDSAGNLNARISEFTLPADGTYAILVSGFEDAASGDYTVTLEGEGGTIVPTEEPTLEPTAEPTTVADGGDIGIGDTVTGTLGRDLQSTYTFQGEAGQMVDISLTSDMFDTFLRLADPSGRELISDDDGGGGLNSHISLFRLPETGLYTIIVESYNDVTGDFTLSLSASRVEAVEYGDTVNAALSDDLTSIGYRFSGEAGDVVTITLRSVEFDTYLALTQVGGDGLTLVENDDGGGGTDSLIGPYTLPATGEYIIGVRGYDAAEVGKYTLSVTRAVLNTINFGEPVTVTFDGQDSAQYFSFEGVAGDVISVRVNSGGTIDTSLGVSGPDNMQLFYDDDSGPDFDPEIIRLILPQDGTYTLLLQPFTASATGEVELSLTRAEARSLDDGPQEIHLNEKLTQDVLSFTGNAGETVRVNVAVTAGGNNAPNFVVTQAGNTIATATASSTGALSFEFTVPDDGLVTIHVTDYNFSAASLRVSLERVTE